MAPASNASRTNAYLLKEDGVVQHFDQCTPPASQALLLTSQLHANDNLSRLHVIAASKTPWYLILFVFIHNFFNTSTTKPIISIMVSSTRKQPERAARTAKKPIQEVELPELPEKKRVKTGDLFKDTQPDDTDVEPESEEISDYEKPRKRASSTKTKPKAKSPTKKPRRTRQPSPEIPVVPDMSDMEDEEDRDDDLRMFDQRRKTRPADVKATVLPKVLRLEVRTAPTTININISDLLSRNSQKDASNLDEALDGTTLMSNDDVGHDPAAKDLVSMRLNPEYASFLELEPELRNRIYRDVLKTDHVVKFNPKPRLARTAALLRTCHQIHEEARGILYGENAFHFDRTEKSRGQYWDEEWKEVGYKDVRRFLESIGPDNIARMRFLSLRLSDAAPLFTPKMDAVERRYQNDPILHHVLRLIGNSGVLLEKFAVSFNGRAEVTHSDVAFIRALTTIKCRKLIKSCKWGHSKISYWLFNELEDFMKAPQLVDVDEKRRKVPQMEHETTGRLFSNRWRCDE